MNSPEAKQIEAVLAAHHLDTGALPVAYSFGFEYHRYLSAIGDETPAQRFHLEACISPMRFMLERRVEVTEEFLADLTAIQPTVFWYQPLPGSEDWHKLNSK